MSSKFKQMEVQGLADALLTEANWLVANFQIKVFHAIGIGQTARGTNQAEYEVKPLQRVQMIRAKLIICHHRSGMRHVRWWKSMWPLPLFRYVCKSFCTFERKCVCVRVHQSFSICKFLLFALRCSGFYSAFCDRFEIGTWLWRFTIQMNRGQWFALWPECVAWIMTGAGWLWSLLSDARWTCKFLCS